MECYKSILWNRPYGWRAGARYIDPDASAAAVIRYELAECGNELDVPEFLLEELDRQQMRARDVVWVCRTREHARRYGGPGRGQPYREEFGAAALILAMDGDTGYLVLGDASALDPAVVEAFAGYREIGGVGARMGRGE